MAAHKVKCKYCQTIFDTNKEPYIYIESSRRYAHKECAEKHEANKSQEEKDLEALEKYIMHLFDEPYVNARVRKQLKEYKEQYNFTYSGILKTLIYWYEIKGNSTEKANGGIGIIPYVYNDALKYYYSLYLAQLANEDKNINEYKNNVITIEAEAPYIYTQPPHLFDLDKDWEV